MFFLPGSGRRWKDLQRFCTSEASSLCSRPAARQPYFGIQSIWSILCLIIWTFTPFITFKFQSRFHLFSEVGEEMTEACWLFSFSTRSALSSALINSSNEVNEELELVALKSATSFWPKSSCSEDARSGLKCLSNGTLTSLKRKDFLFRWEIYMKMSFMFLPLCCPINILWSWCFW